MARSRTSIDNAIAFTAALAEGRACLSFDREGEARLTLIISQQEAAPLAARLPELFETAFRVTLTPEVS